jgi:hypothetical protein
VTVADRRAAIARGENTFGLAAALARLMAESGFGDAFPTE